MSVAWGTMSNELHGLGDLLSFVHDLHHHPWATLTVFQAMAKSAVNSRLCDPCLEAWTLLSSYSWAATWASLTLLQPALE